MKRVITNYTFDASARTITFINFTKVIFSDVIFITNLTKGIVIFDPNNAALDGSIIGNVLTLDYDTSTMSDTDYLKIEYDYKQLYDETNAVDGYDNVDITTSGYSGEKGVRVFIGETDSNSDIPYVFSKSHVSSENSSTTPLGVDGIFEGNWTDTLNYTEIIVSIGTDAASVANGLAVLWSADGITMNGDDLFTIEANADKTFSFPCQRRYVKVTYTNSVVAQAYFNLSTILKPHASKGSSHNIKNNIVPDDDAILTKSVLTGQGDDDIFRNAKVSIGQRLQTISQPYTYGVSEGDLLNHYPLLKFGTRTSVLANTSSVIWEGASALYAYMTIAQQLKISSTSAQDAVGGTGAITINLIGLDADYNEITDTITMTGLAVVTSNLSFLRIFRAYVVTCGTSLTNVGKITINNNAGTTEQAIINIGDGQTLMSIWTVPANKQAFLVNTTFSSDTNKGATISLFTKLNNGGIIYPYQIKYRAYIFGGENNFPFQLPFKIAAKTDIEVRVLTPASAGTTSAGATFELWYEDV